MIEKIFRWAWDLGVDVELRHVRAALRGSPSGDVVYPELIFKYGERRYLMSANDITELGLKLEHLHQYVAISLRVPEFKVT